MIKHALCILSAATALALMAVPLVSQQPYTKAGALSCRMAPTIGLIIGSRQTMRCEFIPERGPPEYYSGVISRIGLDLGVTAGGQMAWAVLASVERPARGALTGTYVGGSGDISLGLGVGANVLFGGSANSIALQPISIEGQIGLNLALGLASLQLQPTL